MSAPPEAAGDVSTGPLTYGNPLPASWGPLIFARSEFTVALRAPGAEPSPFQVVIDRYGPTSGAADLRPLVSPVRNIRIDGANALTVESVAASPKVEWDPPSVGRKKFGVGLLRWNTMPPAAPPVGLRV